MLRATQKVPISSPCNTSKCGRASHFTEKGRSQHRDHCQIARIPTHSFYLGRGFTDNSRTLEFNCLKCSTQWLAVYLQRGTPSPQSTRERFRPLSKTPRTPSPSPCLPQPSARTGRLSVSVVCSGHFIETEPHTVGPPVPGLLHRASSALTRVGAAVRTFPCMAASPSDLGAVQEKRAQRARCWSGLHPTGKGSHPLSPVYAERSRRPPSR